jgi:hypothetical protein
MYDAGPTFIRKKVFSCGSTAEASRSGAGALSPNLVCIGEHTLDNVSPHQWPRTPPCRSLILPMQPRHWHEDIRKKLRHYKGLDLGDMFRAPGPDDKKFDELIQQFGEARHFAHRRHGMHDTQRQGYPRRVVSLSQIS